MVELNSTSTPIPTQEWVLNCKSELISDQAVLLWGEDEETSLGRAIWDTKTLIS